MANYKNAAQQAQQVSTAIVARLTKNHFALTADVAQSLVAQGLSEAQLPMLASTCLAINVPPNLLRYNHNIPSVVRALKLVTQLGYRPGEDFYTSVFKADTPVLSEDGEPTDDKVKAPTVVVMISAARLESNAKEDGRLNGILPVVETSIIEDRDRAKEIFEQSFSGSNKIFDGAIVAEARLYLYHRKSGNPLGSGEPQIFYGFYVPNQTYNGAIQKNFLESGKPKDNHEGPAIARKRAASKAWRAVTRNCYAKDDRPVDVRLAALMDTAQAKLTMAEQIANSASVTLETAIMDGDEIMERQQANDKRSSAMVATPELDDFNRLLLYEETPTGDHVADGNDNDVIESESFPARVTEWLNEKSPPSAAKAWAIEIGACASDTEARSALKESVDEFGGKLTADNLPAVLLAFWQRQQEKLNTALDTTSVNELQEMAPEPV